MILDNSSERDGFVHGVTMKMTTKKIEDSLCLDPPTSQLILYETNLYTSEIWNAFLILKDDYIIFLPVMSERAILLCAQMNVCVRL